MKVSRKRQLVEEMATIMTNNWIANGDKTESDRESCMRVNRRSYWNFRIDELETMIANVTRVAR